MSGWQVAQAWLLELFALGCVGWLCGNILGMLLANQLIQTVSASLGDLYDTNIGLSIAWDWRSSLYSFYLSLAGAIVACAWPLVRLLRSQPSRLTTRLSLVRFAGAEFTIQALIACACCVAAIALYQAPQTQETGFAIIALMLLSLAIFTA